MYDGRLIWRPKIPRRITRPLPNGLATVEQEIARACEQARRDRASVTLIAVSKTFDADAIVPVIAVGARVFGRKSRAGSQGKMARVNAGLPRHRPASDRAAAIQQGEGGHRAVRRDPFGRSAQHLRSVSQGNRFQQRRPELFVQLNTGEEPQKAGVAPADADAFIAGCRDKYGLEISGLMCIPPVNDAPGAAFRPDREDRRAQRVEEFVDGHECRLRDCDSIRRDPYPGRLCDFRASLRPRVRRHP